MTTLVRFRFVMPCRTITVLRQQQLPACVSRLRATERRRAWTALYAFLRLTDDLADEPGEAAANRRSHSRPGAPALLAALDGHPSHPVHPALAETVRRYSHPAALSCSTSSTGSNPTSNRSGSLPSPSLYPYCYRVASAVGLACVRRVGAAARGDVSRRPICPAEAAGIAFQLTNILRDLGEDLAAAGSICPRMNSRASCPPERVARSRLRPEASAR